MVIKKKDGSIYKLQGPSPIMKNQDFWDDGSQFKLHNFNDMPLQDIPVEEIIVHPKPAPKKKEETLLIYCMPSKNIEIQDDLYGEKRIKSGYGPQFTFQAKINAISDLLLELWSNVDALVEKDSILYIPSQRRWWKVENKNFTDNGFILYCTPSLVQPSFAI